MVELISVKSEKDVVDDKCRVKVDPEKWSADSLPDTIELKGNKLHLFQLPPDFPIQALDGIEIPLPRKRKWSEAVNVPYTSKPIYNHQQTAQKTLELKGKKLATEMETIAYVKDGSLLAGGVKFSSIFHGCELLNAPKVQLPRPHDSVHQLPDGLKQRFVPTGNKRTLKNTDEKEIRSPANKKSKKRKKVLS